ncbi:hypothetical protein [Streptomyces sp. NPDC051452]|uniref:hypothetical protein n=1 Tax=Streptomyces sp. NPDC051452 TaxID=3365654 RepID=UPI0037BC7DAA
MIGRPAYLQAEQDAHVADVVQPVLPEQDSCGAGQGDGAVRAPHVMQTCGP